MSLISKYLIVFTIPLFLLSCSDKSPNFSIDLLNKNSSLKLGETLQATLQNKKEKMLDSVVYTIDGQRLKEVSERGELSEKLSNQKLGDKSLEVKIYFEGTSETLSKKFKLFNNTPPKSYTYEVVNTYPHDDKAFTQGLEFYNGTLYESTGRNGESTIRKIDLETGKILQKADLDAAYFGEGITALNGKLYQLTWQGSKGFVYDIETFEQLKTFSYNKSKEGWGLCNDGKVLFKSDGSSKIWKLNAETLGEEDYIQTVSHKTISKKLNELEWVNGKIYANNWQIDLVSIINPKSGAIEGLIDFRNLRKKVENTAEDDVLNGIAYNKATGKLYVTGKNWNKLFEVKIIEK